MKLMTFQIPGEGGSAGIAETELGQLSKYYQMCRRYGIDYFEENPGNTVYHLVLENQNLLFTFCRRRNQYSIRYLAFGRKQMEEAWLNILDYVKQVHQETGRSRSRVTKRSWCRCTREMRKQRHSQSIRKCAVPCSGSHGLQKRRSGNWPGSQKTGNSPAENPLNPSGRPASRTPCVCLPSKRPFPGFGKNNGCFLTQK